MTAGQIKARADVEALKFSTAQKIRELLDVAREAAQSVDRDVDELETEIIDLVREDV